MSQNVSEMFQGTRKSRPASAGLRQSAGVASAAEDFSPLLRDADGEALVFARPVGVARPDAVVAVARDFDLLKERGARLVGRGLDRVPLALAALRPLGRDARPVDAPPRRLRAGKIHPRR